MNCPAIKGHISLFGKWLDETNIEKDKLLQIFWITLEEKNNIEFPKPMDVNQLKRLQ